MTNTRIHVTPVRSPSMVCGFVILLGLALSGLSRAPVVRDSIQAKALAQPVVPLWAIRPGTQLVGPGIEVVQSSGSTSISGCSPILEFSLTDEISGVHLDDKAGVTDVFVGDAPNDRIVRHVVDASLNHTSVALPIAYGGVWLAVDLDLDGNVELLSCHVSSVG